MMEDFEKNLKNNKDTREGDYKVKNIKTRNVINRFLRSYFKVFVFVFILLFLYLSFSFLIKPKFDAVTHSSDDILEERELEFVTLYRDLQARRAIINNFKKIGENDKYRVERMIPEEYSREDLFVELAYFLIKNNFEASSIEVVDPGASAFQQDRDDLGRRVSDGMDTSGSYDSHLNQIPAGVGSWLAKIVLDDIDYIELKRLLNVLERNLKLIDVFSVDFDPQRERVELETFSYYKNN